MMLTRAELNECIVILDQTVRDLRGAGADPNEAVEITFQASAITADTKLRVSSWDFVQPLSDLFDLAVSAGATYNGIRLLSLRVPPGYTPPAAALLRLVKRLALVSLAKILAATEYESRDQIETTLKQINDLFEEAEQNATDTDEIAVYRAMVKLRAAVVRDLQTRARTLPRMVKHNFARSFPSIVLSQVFYNNSRRSDEIEKENRVYHPMFSPPDIRVLSE